MANHNLPALSGTTYADFLGQISARLIDVAQGLDPASTSVTNPPLNAIRWTSSGNTWQKWNGSAWVAWSDAVALPRCTLTTSGADDALRVVQNGAGNLLRLMVGSATRVLVDTAGRMSLGGAALGGHNLRVLGTAAGSNNAIGVRSSVVGTADATNTLVAMYGDFQTQAGSYTIPAAYCFRAVTGTVGEGSSITSAFGYEVGSSFPVATNNYAFYGNLAAVVGRWNFYAAGTAPNYFAGDLRTNTVVTQATVPTNTNTSATLTAASLLQGLRTGTPTAAITYTLPTGANMDFVFTSLENNMSFEWSVINLAAVTHTITLAANTGHTVFGNMVVQPNASGRFLTRKTAADTFTTYRIA